VVFSIRFSESAQNDFGQHNLKSFVPCKLERVNQGGQNQPGFQTQSIFVNRTATGVAVLGQSNAPADQASCLQQWKEWAARGERKSRVTLQQYFSRVLSQPRRLPEREVTANFVHGFFSL